MRGEKRSWSDETLIAVGWAAPISLVALLTSGLLLLMPSQARARSIALVIGNAAYEAAPRLMNPGNDARGIAQALRNTGFEVSEHLDLDKAGMDRALQQFARRARGAKVALFFYAGHGLAVQDKNYLMPIDAKLDDSTDLDFETLPLETVTRVLESEPRISLIFLDACRDNPLARSLARGLSSTRSIILQRGLAVTNTGTGALIAYATQPGYVADDGRGQHSPFTAGLLRHIGTPGLEIRQILTRVRNDVLAATGGRQQPWDHSSLTSDFYFHESTSSALSSAALAGNKKFEDQEEVFWRGIVSSPYKEDFETYLELYPNGLFARAAQRKLQALVSIRSKPHSSTDVPALPGAERIALPMSSGAQAAEPSFDTGARQPVQSSDSTEFEVYRHIK